MCRQVLSGAEEKAVATSNARPASAAQRLLYYEELRQTLQQSRRRQVHIFAAISLAGKNCAISKSKLDADIYEKTLQHCMVESSRFILTNNQKSQITKKAMSDCHL
eukprot:6175486-Pleurochrysis_carterae.AAC.1